MIFSLKKIIYGLSVLSVGLILSYLYFVNSSIIKLVEKKNEENIIKTVNSRLASLESDYMRLRAGLNMDLAKKLGFESVTKVEFAPDKKASPVRDIVSNRASQGLSLRVNAEI